MLIISLQDIQCQLIKKPNRDKKMNKEGVIIKNIHEM